MVTSVLLTYMGQRTKTGREGARWKDREKKTKWADGGVMGVMGMEAKNR